MDQPRARIDVVRDEHFGETVEDPYRWMEDWRGDELRSWVGAQGAYTRAYLDALPHREEILNRITELSAASPFLYNFQIAGGLTFYLRRDAGENVPKLVMRAGVDQPERVLLDPAEGGGDAHTVIDWYFPSLDGRYVAYGISQGGSEESILYVLETDSGRRLADEIPGTRFGGVQWLDGDHFFYHRLAAQPAGAPEVDRYRDSRAYLHRLGDDPADDPAVFGNGINPRIQILREDFPFVWVSPRSDWMIGRVMRGVQPESILYAAPLAGLGDPSSIPWEKVVDVEDAVTGSTAGGSPFALDGNTLYARTFKNAPRYEVIGIDLRDPTRRRTLVPASDLVVEDVQLAGPYIVTRDLEDGIGRMRRVRLNCGEITPIPLPVEGTISGWTTSAEVGEVLLKAESWIVPPQIYRFSIEDPRPEDTGWIPSPPIDLSNLEAHEVTYPGRDGTDVPLSLVHRRGLSRDGNNPTIVTAYGSYGLNLSPVFQPAMIAWFERGGVYAVAHVRGGGERGKEWYEAGRKLNKQNTIDDFVAAAQWLIREGYTSPPHLAGMGTSGGGIPSGNALVQHPDLWAVMVMRVAVTNFLRFEFSENGVPNIPEFGTVTTEEGFRGLQIMDSYTKVRDGVPYPAALITTGLNDPRVVVWQATKMAARLQVATSSGNPVLLRVETQGGHGIGSTRKQLDVELADTFAFLLDEFGRERTEIAVAGAGTAARL